jgi:hypothetical protein
MVSRVAFAFEAVESVGESEALRRDVVGGCANIF